MKGLFRLPRGDKEAALWICGRFDVLGYTRDTDGEGHGLLLRWRDADGLLHEWVLPFAMLAGEASDWRARLASGGLRLSPRLGARQALVDFLSQQKPADRVRTVPRVGFSPNTPQYAAGR